MSAHTPGPWRAHVYPIGSTVGSTREHLHVLDEHGCFVADCTGPSMTQDEKHRANARLVAAAPDLRRELSALVTRCDGPEGVRADGSNIDTRAAHALLERLMGEPEEQS